MKLKTFLSITVALFLLAMAATAQKTELRIGGSYYFPKGKVKPLADYFESKMDVKCTTVDFASTKELNAKLKSGEIDLAFLNPYSYVLAREVAVHVEPLVVLGDNEGPYTYKSCIIANADAGIHSMEEMVKKSRKLDFKFVHATSTSGHIVPRFHMKNFGMDQVEGHFHSVSFAGSHEQSILQVKNGDAHVGACGLPDIKYARDAGLIQEGEVKILWKSHDITGSPLVAQSNLDPEVKQGIIDLMTQLHTGNPILWKHIEDNWQATNPKRFIEAKDEDWDRIRSVADSIEDLIIFLTFYLG